LNTYIPSLMARLREVLNAIFSAPRSGKSRIPKYQQGIFLRNQHRFYLLNHYTESLSVMSLTKLSLNTRMIGFMSDQMLETAPRLTRAVSDETSFYAGAGQNIGQNTFNIIIVICTKEHIERLELMYQGKSDGFFT
ncbi:TPA: hypothetical protein ACHG84_002205, partial [Escherichia coli]